MLRLELLLADASEWFRVFDTRDGTLLVGHRTARPARGASVRVDVVVGAGGPRVIFRGAVIDHRDDATVVAINAHERIKLNYLNGYVRGGLLDLRAKRRIPLRLPVTFGGFDGQVQAYTRDINDEGVFVVCEEPLPEDTEVSLLITFPHLGAPMALLATVAHTVLPDDEDTPGMGCVFQPDGGGRDALRSAVDELERRFLANALPDRLLE